MAPALVTIVLYPRSNATHFNFEYYLTKHIPLAKEIWREYGMQIHSIQEMSTESGYHLACVIEWHRKDGYEQAQKDGRTKEIEHDIGSGNFTNATPVFLMGKMIGKER